MKIILDTNVVYQDFLLEQPNIKILVNLLSGTKDELCIPEVVFEETVRHFKEQYQKALKNQKQDKKIFEVIGGVQNQMPNLDEATDQYRARLKYCLESLKARVIPLPEKCLRDLFLRYIRERIPFYDSGKGFSDALLWETVLEECTRHDEIIAFVTNDSRFVQTSEKGSETTNLHQHLIDDLSNAGFGSDRIIVYRGLYQFMTPLAHKVKRTIIKNLNPSDMLTRYSNSALSALMDHVLDLLDNVDATVGRVSFTRQPENVKIVDAFDWGENDIHVLIRADIVFDVELYTGILDDLRRLIGSTRDHKNKTILLRDLRWNENTRLYVVILRLAIVADFIFIWNIQNNSAKDVKFTSN